MYKKLGAIFNKHTETEIQALKIITKNQSYSERVVDRLPLTTYGLRVK